MSFANGQRSILVKESPWKPPARQHDALAKRLIDLLTRETPAPAALVRVDTALLGLRVGSNGLSAAMFHLQQVRHSMTVAEDNLRAKIPPSEDQRGLFRTDLEAAAAARQRVTDHVTMLQNLGRARGPSDRPLRQPWCSVA
jgi:NAD(P)H-dependent FMN reductase